MLAVPEELLFRNGRNRYLARMALKDVLPLEYQDRRPVDHDDMKPDFLAMAKRIEPQVLAEIDRRAGRIGWSTAHCRRN